MPEKEMERCMTDIDSYIQRFNIHVQKRLTRIRLTALDVFTNAEERLYHGLPAFSQQNKIILFYGAYKNHIAICVGNDWVDFLKQQYPQFHYTQYTITFQHGEPFPEGVIQIICELLARGQG